MHSIKKTWYVVYTRPRWEKKVADLLERRKIESYCPLNKVQRQWSDRKKTVDEPLFTSYVFVRLDETEFGQVKGIDGVINFVYWLGKPAGVREEEIATIREFLTDYRDVKLEKTVVSVHDAIRIVGGPLMTQKGSIVSIKNKTVKVILPSLGYMMYADVDTAHIELDIDQKVHLEKNQWSYAFK